MKLRRSILACLGFCILVAGAASCSKSTDTDLTGEAVSVARTWLTAVDKGEYGLSWEQSADLFKGAVTKAAWEQTLGVSRKSLGDLVSRSVKSADYATSLPGAPDGEYVVIRFATVFANKQSAVETVTPMKDADGVWRVSGYFIK